jgi:O-methyltransferase
MSRGSIGLSPELNDYIVKAHTPEHPVLRKLRQKTGRMPMGGMQIAPEQGQFLAFLVRLIGARRTLEIGTFTGYSALAVALALPENGRIVACDVSEEWTAIARKHWEEAGVDKKIALRLAPALETLAALETEGKPGRFDFAFIDAHKPEYDAYYEACLRLVRVGGLIALDNMLQGGRVADRGDRSAGAVAIRALNARIAKDDRVDAVLLPVGDGLTLARRVK